MNKIYVKDRILKVNNRLKYIKNIFLDKNIFNRNDYNVLISEYNNLIKIKNCYDKLKIYIKELNFARSLLKDRDFFLIAKDEINKLVGLIKLTEKKLNLFLNIKKKHKEMLGVYLEICAGTGGNEAALFVSDLFKMYYKYAELSKWKVELINSKNNSCGGYKDILIKIIGSDVYSKLRFESGGHRVQRVPFTESKGRVHTSTCLVAVIPDFAEEKLPVVNVCDLKIDTFKSSGAGGQHVNTTNSAVRITHLPTGLVVECQQERSQHKNKLKALSVLKARIYSLESAKRNLKKNDEKKSLLGTGFRCDRNRTYNFIQNRVTDHRINLTLYSLNRILNGDLNLLIDPISCNIES